jgi:hypothetical protein
VLSKTLNGVEAVEIVGDLVLESDLHGVRLICFGVDNYVLLQTCNLRRYTGGHV